MSDAFQLHLHPPRGSRASPLGRACADHYLPHSLTQKNQKSWSHLLERCLECLLAPSPLEQDVYLDPGEDFSRRLRRRLGFAQREPAYDHAHI